MTDLTFPSVNPAHRRADLIVHLVGLCLILFAGGLLLAKATLAGSIAVSAAVVIYIACALISNLASCAYHFSSLHDSRVLLRRIDHAAIYPSISGTFTPFFILADTPWTWTLLWLCWGLTALAIWHKITGAQVKSRWSTASYLGLGAIGLSALPHLSAVPLSVLWCIIAGAVAYVIGVCFYAQRTRPYRYAIWHAWVNLGGVMMFAGVWIALG